MNPVFKKDHTFRMSTFVTVENGASYRRLRRDTVIFGDDV